MYKQDLKKKQAIFPGFPECFPPFLFFLPDQQKAKKCGTLRKTYLLFVFSFFFFSPYQKKAVTHAQRCPPPPPPSKSVGWRTSSPVVAPCTRPTPAGASSCGSWARGRPSASWTPRGARSTPWRPARKRRGNAETRFIGGFGGCRWGGGWGGLLGVGGGWWVGGG